MNSRPTRRRTLGFGAVAIGFAGGLAQPLIGVRPATAQNASATPETVVYVSNAGDPSIQVLAMDRKTGDLRLIDKTNIPGAAQPSPRGMPLAVSPDRRFLYAALGSRPLAVASFAIDPASGQLKHLGNAPLDAE